MADLAVLKYVRPWRDVAIISIVLLAFAAAPALGATVTQAPTISGGSTAGSQLTASVGAWTPASATPTYDWLRCGASGAACAPISGACGREYRITTDDEGHSLRVRLTVTDSAGEADFAISGPTAAVQSRPYAENVKPTDTCTEVTRTGPGRGTFSSGEETGAGTTPTPGTSLNFIDPFPIIRISGRFKGKRTTLTRVLVTAPRGARIRIACKGRGCPYKRKAIRAKLIRIRSLQRTYRPKARIEIRVTQRHKIGKYTRIQTRRGKAPVRVDRCLMPGKTRPVKCPTG